MNQGYHTPGPFFQNLHVFGQNHGVDYTDDAIAGHDIGFDDPGVVYHGVTAAHTHHKTFTVYCSSGTHILDIRRKVSTRDDVIGQRRLIDKCPCSIRCYLLLIS